MSHDILLAFHGIIVAVLITGDVPQGWEKMTFKILHKKKYRNECGNNKGLSLMAHAGEVILKIVTIRPDDLCEAAGILFEEQCGFRPQRSATDMYDVRRAQPAGNKTDKQHFIYRFASSIWQKRTTLLSIACYYGKFLLVSDFPLG